MSTNLKKIALIALCAVIFVATLSVTTVFASDVDFLPIEAVYVSDTDLITLAYAQEHGLDLGNSYLVVFTSSVNVPVEEIHPYYCNYFFNQNTLAGRVFTCIKSNVYVISVDKSNGNKTWYSLSSAYLGSSVVPSTFNSSAPATDLTAPFADSDSATNGYQNFRDDGFATLITKPLDFSLYPGQALVIEGACDITDRSYYINNSYDFSSNGSMRVNGSSERIIAIGNVRDGFSPDQNLDKDQLVQWDALNANVLGTASNYSFTGSDTVSFSSGACFVVTYPLYYGVGQTPHDITFENAVSLVGQMQLTYSGTVNTYVVPMECIASWSSQGYLSYYSVFRPGSSSSSGTVTDDDNGITVSPGTIPSGGANAGQPPVSEETNLFGLLSRFVNQIVGLITNASQSISQLISAGSGFMQNLAGLFTWLPQPVYTCLVSALIIAVSVGVFKLLF